MNENKEILIATDKKGVISEQNENRGIYPLNINIEETSFDDWMSEFKVHDDAKKGILNRLSENTIESLETLVLLMINISLEKKLLTDRYDLMTNFVVELYTVYGTVAEDVSELIYKLIHAIHRLDTECGLESGLTENLKEEARASTIMLLDVDEKRFEHILREEYWKLNNEIFQYFFLEFARCIHAFNGYQPPPRKDTEVDKFANDVKSPIFHFEPVLIRLQQFFTNLMDKKVGEEATNKNDENNI